MKPHFITVAFGKGEMLLEDIDSKTRYRVKVIDVVESSASLPSSDESGDKNE